MSVRTRWPLVAPAARASLYVVLALLVTARLLLALDTPDARYLPPENTGVWAVLLAAAGMASVALGGACLWHAAMLRRLSRIRRVDWVIAGLGFVFVVVWIAMIALWSAEPDTAWLVLAVGLPLWLAGLGFLALCAAMIIFAGRPDKRVPPRTVLILGAGLRGREVGPLLRRRVERGAEVWRRGQAKHKSARIVVSGGQGSDEVRTEASAMAEFLVRNERVPEACIDLEERSSTTRENLEFSKPYIAEGPRRPLSVVTSDYHAYRTAWLLAALSIEGRVVGAPTRSSYRPGASVREGFAIVSALWPWAVALSLTSLALAAWLLTAS